MRWVLAVLLCLTIGCDDRGRYIDAHGRECVQVGGFKPICKEKCEKR